jgi:hypothetical protein
MGRVQVGFGVSEALGAFVASLNGYRSRGDGSRLAPFDPESTPAPLFLETEGEGLGLPILARNTCVAMQQRPSTERARPFSC